MSGKPYPEGVERVITLLEHASALDVEIARLEAQTRDLDDMRKRRANIAKELRGKLQEMDLESTGHYGWENRMTWFLGEMHRRMSARTPQESKSEDET